MPNLQPWMNGGAQIICRFIFFAMATQGICQVPVRSLAPETYSSAEYAALREQVGKNKVNTDANEKQILVALGYFPELANTKIEFRFKRTNTAFSTRPSIGGIFQRRSHRKYIITISDSTEKILVPLLLKNLPYNAQVGIIGHELSHVADFNNKKFFGLLRNALGHVSQKYLNRFERKTDSLCIVHGLGYQLLSWSSYIRSTMHTENWTGSVNIHKGPMRRERYMNPSTIQKQIDSNPLYKGIR